MAIIVEPVARKMDKAEIEAWLLENSNDFPYSPYLLLEWLKNKGFKTDDPGTINDISFALTELTKKGHVKLRSISWSSDLQKVQPFFTISKDI